MLTMCVSIALPGVEGNFNHLAQHLCPCADFAVSITYSVVALGLLSTVGALNTFSRDCLVYNREAASGKQAACIAGTQSAHVRPQRHNCLCHAAPQA